MKYFLPWPRMKASRLLGIDIQRRFIHAVEMFYHSDFFYVASAIQYPLPTNDRESPFDNLPDIAACIKSLLLVLNSTTVQAVISLPDALVMQKNIAIPEELSHLDKKAWLRWQAELAIPDAALDMYVDYDIITPHSAVLMAVRHQSIEKRIAALQAAGLYLDAVDIHSRAIERVLRAENLQFICRQQSVAVFTLHDQWLSLFVLTDMKTAFTDEGDRFCDLSVADLLEKIIGHLKYFKAACPDILLNAIILSGDFINLPHIEKSIMDATRLPTYFLFSKNSKLGTISMIAYGLALRHQHLFALYD